MAHINHKYIDSHWLIFVIKGLVAIGFGAFAIFDMKRDFASPSPLSNSSTPSIALVQKPVGASLSLSLSPTPSSPLPFSSLSVKAPSGIFISSPATLSSAASPKSLPASALPLTQPTASLGSSAAFVAPSWASSS